MDNDDEISIELPNKSNQGISRPYREHVRGGIYRLSSLVVRRV